MRAGLGRLLLGVGLTLVGSDLPAADDVSLTANVNARRIGVEDQVQLEVSVSGRSIGSGEEIGLPPLENLRLAGGPFVSTQISFVNGAVSQSKTYTYVLTPLAEGKAKIGAIRAHLGGVERITAPIEITVVAGSVRPQRQARQDPFGWDPFGNDPLGEDPFEGFFGRRRRQPARAAKIFVETALGARRARVGEGVLLTYQLFTQAAVSDLKFKEQPQYPGFWVEELPSPSGQIQGTEVTVDGERYYRFPVLERLLFPTRAGELSIPAARLRIALSGRSLLGGAPSTVERETKALTLSVDPIPEQPGFSGAVGKFEAQADLDRAEVALGDAVTLRFSVSGKGNLKWIEHGPEVEVPGAKVYPPQAKADVKVGKSGMWGKRTWEYVIVPETGGRLAVPELTFTYFDPSIGRLEEARTAELTIDVQGGAAAVAGPHVGAERPAPSVGVREGLALRTDLERRAVGGLGAGALALMVLGLVLAHGLLLGLSYWRELMPRAQRRGGAPGRTSRRQALAEIERARRTAGSKEAAAGLIEKALSDVFGDLESAPKGEGTRAARAVLDEVRFLRYAPQLGDYSEKIRELAERAARVVRRFG